MLHSRPFAIPAVLLLFILAVPVLAKDPPAVESKQQTQTELARIVDQLNALGAQFDADKNQELSRQEQEAMQKYVADKFGRVWAQRLKTFLKDADANGDGRITLAEWNAAIAKLRKRGLGTGTAKTIMVPMRDGKRMATDVYLPEGDGPFPVLFLRTPYSRVKPGHDMSRGYTAAGVAVVAQDMRGRFDSEGENLPFIGCGWGEHCDGFDSVEWIRRQPWCDGKVGTLGESACGITQCLMAGAAPRGLTAQYIIVAPASMYEQASYVGGALRKCQIEGWTRNNHFDEKALDIMRAHPSYDDYWQQFDTRTRFERMTTPAVHVGGWFDTFAQGTIDSFVGRQHHGGPAARGTQKLVMGPWSHAIGRQPVGELTFRAAEPPKEYDAGLWFEHYLLGVDNGVEKLPAVTYYVMGDTADRKAPGNQWRQADDWPVPSRPTAYYFAQDGLLTTSKPTQANVSTTYTFDPADPCPTIGGNNLEIPAGPRNQNPIESRKDVVLFTTQPLAEPLEVTGHVTAKVYVASSAVDTDLSVRLCDVYPDGKSFNMAEGMLRLRFRNGFEKPEPLVPGELTEVTVDCWSTSVVFNRGHRIRVAVTSSNLPRFDVNPGTAKPWQAGDRQVKQTNRIEMDASHPSCIVLPVVEGK